MDHSPATGPSVPKMTSSAQIRLVALLAIGVVALMWGLPLLLAAWAPPPPPPAAASADGSFVATDPQWQTLRFATVQSTRSSDYAASEGRIATDDDLTTAIVSPFTGQVTRIAVKQGDAVHKGQVLFTVAAAEATQNQADLATAGAQVTVARAAEARLHDLFDHNGAALKDWQQAQADLVAAQAALAAAQGRRASLGGAIVNGEGIVRAPIDGIVTQRLIGPGQTVAGAASGNASAALTIANFGRVWLIGNLREEDAAAARVGQLAEVRVLGSDEVLHARVTYVAPMIDPATRRLTVRAELPNPDGHLKPESLVRFTLFTGHEHLALTVPEDAVLFEGQTAHVWVADAGHHRLALRQITAGHVANGTVEVTGGLRTGETVVTAGSLFIDRGAKAD